MNQTRIPDDCVHRLRLSGDEVTPSHFCGLLSEITGIGDESLLRVRPDQCGLCCRQREPKPEKPNGLLASLLYPILSKIKKAGGMPGCDLEKVEILQSLVNDNLPTINIPAMTGGALSAVAPPYSSQCRHLGLQIGEQPCKTCRGNVRQKVFACHHPRHANATIRGCQACGDYTPGSGRHAVETWVVGVTTAPREKSTLRRTLKSLRSAGWEDLIYLFAEPGTQTGAARRNNNPTELISRQGTALGAWGNFLLALSELHLREPLADAYLMVQDDVIFCRGLRDYLEEHLWPGPKPGVISLHTPSHLAAKTGTGFFQADLGWNAWGAQAFVFSNASARALLADSRVIDHRLNGLFEGKRNVDSVVGDWCRRSGREFYLHAPSLAEHIGNHSTLWPKAGLNGQRSSSDFPGEKVTASSAVERHREGKGAHPPSTASIRSDGTLVLTVPTPQNRRVQEKVSAEPPRMTHLRTHDSVAVIVIGRNDGRYLKECLDSVFAQSITPDEVVYIDDAGSDDSMEIAATFSPKGLQAMRLPQNLGMSGARMEGLKMTISSLLLFVDSDNVLPPDYLALMLEDIGVAHDFVYPAKEFFGEEKEVARRRKHFPDGRWYPPEADRARLWRSNYADTCSLMRREAFLTATGWRGNPADTMFDWDLALRLTRNGSHARSRAMLRYRVHGNNWSEREREHDRPALNGLVRRHAASLTVATIWSGRIDDLQSTWIEAVADSLKKAQKSAELLILDDSVEGINLHSLTLPDVFDSFQVRRVHRGVSTEHRRPDRRATAEFLASACNEALTRASGDIVWFIEDDIIVPETACDTLLRELLQSPKGPRPAVGGCYRTRHQPSTHWIAAHVRENRVVHLQDLPNSPFPVHLTGTGCLMVLRDLLRGTRFRTEWNHGLLRSTGHDWSFVWALHEQDTPVILVPDVICRHHLNLETWV
ncbi:MAG: glycosyltransferase family 2 protein [Verrucomicrobiae bacterium]|nr:glycosyltransferase family 2 protein [Verrucomicrobiae bacterium]